MKFKTKLIQWSLGLALLVGAGVASAQEVFFGEDPGSGDNNVPLGATPNADAARAAFFERLVLGGTGTEDFEGFTAGEGAPLVVDFTVLTATLTGSGQVANVTPGTTDGDGRYATSGAQYWDTDQNFTVDFSQPVQAFGFYGIDMGDFAGQLTITYDTGVQQNVDIPHTVNGPTGSVLYFGFVSPQAFSSITFSNSDQGDVFAFDDFTVQLTVPPPPPGPPSVAIPTQSPLGLGVLAALLLLVGGLAVRRP